MYQQYYRLFTGPVTYDLPKRDLDPGSLVKGPGWEACSALLGLPRKGSSFLPPSGNGQSIFKLSVASQIALYRGDFGSTPLGGSDAAIMRSRKVEKSDWA